MRNTVHPVTAADVVSFRPGFQPPMERAVAGNVGPNLGGVDLAELQAVAPALLAEIPLTRGQLADRAALRRPDHHPVSLSGSACPGRTPSPPRAAACRSSPPGGRP